MSTRAFGSNCLLNHTGPDPAIPIEAESPATRLLEADPGAMAIMIVVVDHGLSLHPEMYAAARIVGPSGGSSAARRDRAILDCRAYDRRVSPVNYV